MHTITADDSSLIWSWNVTSTVALKVKLNYVYVYSMWMSHVSQMNGILKIAIIIVSFFSIHVPLQQSIFSKGNHFIHSNHLMDVTGMVCSKLIRKIETLCFAIIVSIFSIHEPLQQSIFSQGNHFIHILITSRMSPGWHSEDQHEK